MKNKEFPDMGDQIKDLVQNAINSMDFKNLNEQITNTVNSTLDEVKEQLKKTTEQVNDAVSKEWNLGKNQSARPKPINPPNVKPKTAVTKYGAPVYNLKGRTPGILCVVFGSIGGGLTLIGIIAFAIVTAVIGLSSFWTVPTFFVLGLLFSVFAGLYGNGISILKRVKRLKRYFKVLGNQSFCSIKELAAYSGRSEKYVLKDLLKMINTGLLPEGHLDELGTCFMVDDQTYGQYLSAQKAMRQREEEERKRSLENKREDIKKVMENRPRDQQMQELDKLIREGEEYIRRLRQVNDAIPGEIISAKLYRLERVTSDIFDTVKKHPSQMPQMQKFMDYYLPTTLKLVTAYQEFDSLEIQGDNVRSAKAEVEKTLDTINLAFENLLDDLYQIAAFDVAADASVLQTMFAKEGLTESDFKEER